MVFRWSICVQCTENCLKCSTNYSIWDHGSCAEKHGAVLDENKINTGKCAPCIEHCDFCRFDNSRCNSSDYCHEHYGMVLDENKDSTGICAHFPTFCETCSVIRITPFYKVY